MKRLVKLFLFLIAFNCFTACATINKEKNNVIDDTQKSISIKDFGAIGDGKHDDFQAFVNAAKYFNTNKEGILYLPKGNYYINKISDTKNGVDIIYENINSLKIIGDSAKITLNGNLNRYTTNKRGRFKYSFIRAVNPFVFKNVKKLTIKGIEIDGGVLDARKDKGIVESFNFLLKLTSCENVILEDLNLHHSLCDGIYINGKSRNFSFKKIISSNNGRQGMSIISLQKAVFENCSFVNTGVTGEYGYNAPGAGVDIETGKVGNVKDIKFVGCTFANNKGSQVVITKATNVSDIFFNDCKILAKNSTMQYTFIGAAKNINVDNCEIDAGTGAVYTTWPASPGASGSYTNNHIKSSDVGIMSTGKIDGRILINGNIIEYTGKKVSKSYFPYIQKNTIEFTNNTVIIPQKYWKKRFNSLIQLVNKAEGNKYIDENGNSFIKMVSFNKAKDVFDK